MICSNQSRFQLSSAAGYYLLDSSSTLLLMWYVTLTLHPHSSTSKEEGLSTLYFSVEFLQLWSLVQLFIQNYAIHYHDHRRARSRDILKIMVRNWILLRYFFKKLSIYLKLLSSHLALTSFKQNLQFLTRIQNLLLSRQLTNLKVKFLHQVCTTFRFMI